MRHSPSSSRPPAVSVVLATFNGERFLQRQLDSIAAQQILPDELVIGDDGSTDASVALLERFRDAAPFPVRLTVHPAQVGFRRNFMQAAAEAKGDLILFCDQDDIWLPDKIARIRDAFAADPALSFLYHNATVVYAEERLGVPMFDDTAERAAVDGGAMRPWHYARGLVQAFRADLRAYDDLWPDSREHFSDEPMGHDRWYFFLALALGKVGYCERPLLLYRQHGGNAFGADWTTSWRDRLSRWLVHSPGGDQPIEAGARARARILRTISARLPAERRAGVEEWADRYARFADTFERRRQVYTLRTMMRRGQALSRALRCHDYRAGEWGLNPGAIPRDVVGGVLFGGLHR